jgi:hypothetical protein
MSEKRGDEELRVAYSERPVEIVPEGLKCGCGAMMQVFTEHRSEHGGMILSKIYVCPRCNNEAGMKLGSQTLL